MILLQVNQVARLFGADILFQHIQMEISSHARIGLVGRNGAGKSTLLKIIAGVEQPDEGAVIKNKQATLSYLAQDTGLISDKTVYDEMLDAFLSIRKLEAKMREMELKMGEVDPATPAYTQLLAEYDRIQHEFSEQNGYGYENEIRSVLHGFQFDASFYDQAISTLSGGQKTRLALAKMLLQKPDILILDEPTNHLDIATLSWLENYLQGYSGALLIVSHDRYFLDKVVTEIYELSRHKMRHYKGNYSRYLDEKATQLTTEMKAFEKQQDEIAKLEDFVARNLVRASTTKRAQSRRKQLEKMERLDRPQGDEKSAHFLFEVEKPSGNIVLQVTDAAIGYEDTILAEPINLDIRKHDAVALVGPNGIGKSTLLKSIIHRQPFLKGQATFGANVSVGYYDQGQAELSTRKTILQELWDAHPTLPEGQIRTVLGSFLFSGEDVEKPIGLLSGGEKARVALAKLAMDHDNFLMLDEPTNHLDIDNKEVLENALIDYDGTIFFVSHDRYFINRIASTVVELSEEGARVFLGDYEYYLEKKQEEAELQALLEQPTIEAVVSEGKQNFQQSKEKQKKIRQLQRKIEEIETQLATLETEHQMCQDKMIQPENLDNHVLLQELTQASEEIEAQQLSLMEEWERISLELEQEETV